MDASLAAERPSRSRDRKSTRLNSSHDQISYAVFCLKKKKDTSELQSRSDLVCRLLLEKKNAGTYRPADSDSRCVVDCSEPCTSLYRSSAGTDRAYAVSISACTLTRGAVYHHLLSGSRVPISCISRYYFTCFTFFF